MSPRYPPITTISQAAAEAAQAMCDLFASIGTVAFDVTWTDLQGAKVNFRGGIRAADLRRWLPGMIAWATKKQLNLIVRPIATGATLIQLDDLNGGAMDRLRPVAFLGLETSPGNFQAWLGLIAKDGSQDFARWLRKGLGADDSASGATRVAGSLNFKPNYAPTFPRVEIIHSAPGRITGLADWEALGLVAPPEAHGPALPHGRRATSAKLPTLCGRCAGEAGWEWAGYQPGGFHLVRMIAIDWGWSIEQVAERLMEVSRKGHENGQRYARVTAENAAEAVRRRRVSIDAGGQLSEA